MTNVNGTLTKEQLGGLIAPLTLTYEGEERYADILTFLHTSVKNLALMMIARTEARDVFKTEDLDLRQTIGRDFIELYAQLEPAARAQNPEKLTFSRAETIKRFAALYHVLDPNTQWGSDERRVIEAAFQSMELGPIPTATHTERVSAEKQTSVDPNRSHGI